MVATMAPPTVQEKFAATRSELADCLIEREEEIDLALTGLIAGEHVLLVGPPGTAKSMLSDGVCSWMNGQRFNLLVTKFTTPEEVFGPISVAGLKADKYRRIIDGKLPTADVAFVDEIFKASSAILNTMLQVLNERTFVNDGAVHDCPLRLCVAASNEWPGDQEGGKELGALFDRFLFRKSVRPIAAEKSLHRLLWTDNLSVSLSSRISGAELDQAHAEAKALAWSPEAQEAFLKIYRECKREGICPGDRRLRKSVGAAQAYAWLNDGAAVEPDHLEVLAHTFWEDPAEHPRKVAEIVGTIANPEAMKLNSLVYEAQGLVNPMPTEMEKIIRAAKAMKEIQGKLAKHKGARAEAAKAQVEACAVQIRELLL